MNRPSRAFAALLLCLFVCSSQAVTVDFESFTAMTHFSGNAIPVDARLSNQLLVSHGVRFSSSAGYVAVVSLGAGHATSGLNGIGGSTSGGVLTYNSDDPIWITFHTNGDANSLGFTDFVSIRGDLHGGGFPSMVNVFDVNGLLLGSQTLDDVGGQTWSFSIPGIHALQFLGQPPGSTTNGIALDDLSFNQVVPEPSTGFVLLSLALLVRRRKKSAAVS